MKKSFLSLTLLFAFVAIFIQVSAQTVPQAFSYQAVVRDAANNLVVNTTLGLQISILQSSPTGAPVYVETQNPVTNSNGLFTVEVGGGVVQSGDFTLIDWAAGPYYIKTEIDLAGGTSYSIEGVSQLLSVPYALYAGSVPADADGDSTNELQTLSISNDTLYISDGNGVELLSGADLDWEISGNNIYNANVLGNVGIGTINPAYRLSVGDTGFFIASVGHIGNFNEVESGRLAFSEDIEYAGGTCGFEFHHNGADNTLSLESGCTTLGDTSIVFTRTGEVRIPERVKIGENSNPNTDVHIKQSSFATTPSGAGIRFEETSTTNQWQIWTGGSDFNFAYNGTRVAYIDDATGAYVQTSDVRLKSNITDMDNVLPKVLKLRPVSFTYNHDKTGALTTGFIAQEVYELFPDLVFTSDDTGYMAVSYAGFGVIAIKAIQEQQEEIELLKQEIEWLKQQIILLQE